MKYNKVQTQEEELNKWIEKVPSEVKTQFYDFINSVPYIKSLIHKDRKYAKDLIRDNKGRIIIDVTEPHILEDMDYFRPSAIFFQKNGCFTKLRPNPNPNSEFGKWLNEEVRRCREGYVRESDGEWITGDYYFYLNYCPIELINTDEDGFTSRVTDFPHIWDGQYYLFHYLAQARKEGKHAMMLASRGKGKSFSGASMLAKRFLLGETEKTNKKVHCMVTASEKKYLNLSNQILGFFQHYIDFLATHTQFPSKRLTSSLTSMQWISGYIESETGIRKGSENSVTGVTSKDDESKLRGSRGALYLIEEMGSFPRLKQLYQVLRPSVEDGNKTFGMIYLYGTSGDNESDFGAAQEMMYSPIGNNIKALRNVFDKEGQGALNFSYFFPAYLNRADCYDKNGNSDVIKALLQILEDRYITKHNTISLNAITKRIAEYPIVPQEAILRVKGNLFPTAELTEQVNRLDNDLHTYDDVIIADLYWDKNNKVDMRLSDKKPIREFPTKDNKVEGAIEIFKLPEKDKQGNVFSNRYIIGLDPADDDVSNTMSLISSFVIDLWTDTIVAEWTGRLQLAESNYEIIRKLCFFYNAKCLYESNKKGTFAYFQRMNCLYLLADCPEYLRDKDLVKGEMIGNKAKGVNATAPINNYADSCIRDWLIKPIVKVEVDENGKDVETTVFNLTRIKNRALLLELANYDNVRNFDRVRALGMAMLYREGVIGVYNKGSEQDDKEDILNDDFFSNFDKKFKKQDNINIFG